HVFGSTFVKDACCEICDVEFQILVLEKHVICCSLAFCRYRSSFLNSGSAFLRYGSSFLLYGSRRSCGNSLFHRNTLCMYLFRLLCRCGSSSCGSGCLRLIYFFESFLVRSSAHND